MKPTRLPTYCGIALAAMCTAGLGHWYSTRQFSVAFQQHGTSSPVTRTLASPAPANPAAKPQITAASVTPTPAASSPTAAGQKEFFEALLAEVKKLRTENLNLVDQMAETNRDLMKLEFRVDTHSESFRPLPVSQERIDTSLDTGPGVLPPRAEPVFPFSDE